MGKSGLVYGDGLDDIKDCLGGGCGLDKIIPSKISEQPLQIFYELTDADG